MTHFWKSFLVFFILVGCASDNEDLTLSSFVPNDSNVIITINDGENLKSNLNNNKLLNGFINTQVLDTLKAKLGVIDSLHIEGKSILAFTDAKNYVFTTKLVKDSLGLDSLRLDAIPNSAVLNDILIIGSNDSILKDAFHKRNNKLTHHSFTKSDFGLKIDDDKRFSNLFFINDSLKNLPVASNLGLAINVSQNQALLNGTSTNKDSTLTISSLFKNTIPQEQLTYKVTPSNSDGFLSLTFDNASTIIKNLNINKEIDSLANTSLFDFISEIGIIYEGTSRGVALRTIDMEATNEVLQYYTSISNNFRNTAIYNFTEQNLFATYFSPFIKSDKFSKYIIIEDFIIFSDATETLYNIIANFQNKTTLSDKAYYQNLAEFMFDEASLTMVTPSKVLQKNAETYDTTIDFKASDFKYAALQIANDIDFTHINIAAKKTKTTSSEDAIIEQFNIVLDNELLTNPQFVKNHRTRQYDIVVQDITNTLYQISNQGKVLWKKRLHGAILGEIKQIDMYRNGRLQLAFATSNRVYVLDRNGNDVKPFPLKFNDEITQPLAIFDYDKKRNYRLFVTQGNNVLLYDGKGKTVKGFNFKKANSNIIIPPKHFRIGDKDYLVFKTKNKLHILNRRGKTRVAPKNTFSFSDEAVYVHEDKFTTTTTSGDLVIVDTRGNTLSTPLDLGSDHNIDATNRTLVTLSDNKLSIRNKRMELDFGEYTPPKIAIANNKLYVLTTDLQTQKVYAYDSKGELITKFPVYGNSTIDINNIDRDKSIEFVTKSGDKGIIVYEMN